MEGQRVFVRIGVRFLLRFLDPSSSREGSAETVDISANGVGFVGNNENLTINTPLEMWLRIPDQHAPFYARGEVVWSRGSGESTQQRIGVRLERAELMGLSRALRLKK